jgi:hypothetical protein
MHMTFADLLEHGPMFNYYSRTDFSQRKEWTMVKAEERLNWQSATVCWRFSV